MVDMIPIFVFVLMQFGNVKTECVDGHKNDEIWHPLACMSCTCINDAITCMNNCAPDLVTSTALTSLSTLEGCEHDGIKRKNGETWRDVGKHSDGINWTKECMQCHCNRSIVMCTIRPCPPLSCKNPIQIKNSCCLTCPDIEKSFTTDTGCTHLSSLFSIGTSWKVYIPNKSKHGKCVKCSCLKGVNEPQEVCEKYKCPELSCSKVIGRPGECCGTCAPGSTESPTKPQDQVDIIKLIKKLFTFMEFNENSMLKIEEGDILNDDDESAEKKPVVEEFDGKRSCKLGSLIYKHKEVFTPKLSYAQKLTNLNCHRCMCEDGRISCKKVICPKTQTCALPQHHPDLCCNVCPGISKEIALTLEEASMVSIGRGYGCYSTKEYFIQVYEYQGGSSDSARFLFDRSRESKKPSEIHTLQVTETKIEVTIKEVRHVGKLLLGYKHIGSIKKKILARIVRKGKEITQETRPEMFAKTMATFIDMIREKSRKKSELCWSSAFL